MQPFSLLFFSKDGRNIGRERFIADQLVTASVPPPLAEQCCLDMLFQLIILLFEYRGNFDQAETVTTISVKTIDPYIKFLLSLGVKNSMFSFPFMTMFLHSLK